MQHFPSPRLGPFRRYLAAFLEVLGPAGRKRLLPLVFGFVFLSLLDVIGLSLIGPFVALSTNTDALNQIPGAATISGILGVHSMGQLVVWMGLSIALVFLFKAFAGFYVNRAIMRAAFQHQKATKLCLLRAYFALPLEQALHKNSANLLTTVNQHVIVFTNRVMIPGLKATSELIFFAFLLVFLFINNPLITLLMGLVFVILALVYDAAVKKKVRASGADSIHSMRASTRIISQAADGFKEIRVAGKEEFFVEALRGHSEVYAQAGIYKQSLVVVPRYMIEASVVAFLVGLLLIGLATHNGPSPQLMSTMGIFAFAALRSMPSVNTLLSASNHLRYGAPALFELHQDLAGIVPEKKSSVSHDLGGDCDFIGFERSLRASGLSYTYPDKALPAVDDVSLCIARGEVVGIIGASGSGKTTLVDLLVGLLHPSAGEVLVDDASIAQHRHAWMGRIAYIPQSVFLLDDTIIANVALGMPPDQVDELKVRHCLELAQLGSLVDTLPDGNHTLVGERGARLSGGQRQRIALARALYDRRDVLVMDEATAALDTKTEQGVVETIKSLRGSVTVILIAHRLTTLRHCDRIYELSAGRLLRTCVYDDIVRDRTT